MDAILRSSELLVVTYKTAHHNSKDCDYIIFVRYTVKVSLRHRSTSS
jgi:hypothetical protein